MKETNNKNLCCSQIKKYLRAAQKLLLLFCAGHWNKQKYFDAFSLLWDDTKSTNCPERAGFAKARYEEFFLFLFTATTFKKGSTKCRPIEFVPSVIVDGLLKGKKIRAPVFVVGV